MEWSLENSYIKFLFSQRTNNISTPEGHLSTQTKIDDHPAPIKIQLYNWYLREEIYGPS